MDKPRIKYYVFTRFYNTYACDAMPKEDFLSIFHLRKKLDIFKKFAYPSLLSQSNQNFVVLLMVHDNIPEVVYDELLLLVKDNDNIRLIKNSEIDSRLNDKVYLLSSALTNYISDDINTNQYDYLITSRFDYDDMLYSDAVHDIQTSITEDTLIKYFGFKNGCTLDYNKNELFKFNKKSDVGLISIGLSMIVNLNVYNNLSFNVYWGHHSKMRDEFIDKKLPEINEVYELSDEYLNSTDFWEAKETKFPAWVYVRHNESKSAYLGRFERKLHYSENPIKDEVIKKYFFNHY